jgi:hypothetical protein
MDGTVVHEAGLNVLGQPYNVQVFGRDNGKYFALTRFSDSDIMIIDGISLEEVLERHCFSLPIAVGCRRRNLKADEGDGPAAHANIKV